MTKRQVRIPQGRPKWISENGIDVIDGPLIITSKELLFFSTICALILSGKVRYETICEAADSIIGHNKMEEFEKVLQKYCDDSVPLWSRDIDGNYRLNIDEFMIEY